MAQQDTPANLTSSNKISWFCTILACFSAVAAGIGVFEPDSAVPDIRLLVGFAIVVAGGGDVLCRIRGGIEETCAGQIAGPLLWTVAAWVLFRLGESYAPQLLILPVFVIAWLVATFPWRVFVFPLLAMLLMEGGLIATGHQSVEVFLFNLGCYTLAAIGLTIFANTEAYRQRMHKAMTRARRDVRTKEYARDFGLFGGGASLQKTVPQKGSLKESFLGDQSTIETVAASLDLQLEVIRQALDLSTIAVLWPDSEGKEFRLRSIATTRDDIVKGPYQVGAGITGALTGPKDEVSMSSVSENYSGLPYYSNKGGVGSIFAIRVDDDEVSYAYGDKKVSAILCADRLKDSGWTETDKQAFRLVTRKLIMDVLMGRRLQAMSQERDAIQQFCVIMRELNAVLGLDQVFEATAKAVGIVVPADFITVSLAQEGHHRIVYAEGKEANRLRGQEFPIDEGLVGQVLKINRSLPAKTHCYGPVAVFSNMQKVSGFNSLLILPLRREEDKPIGALTIAAKETGIFTEARQEILKLIATQVAIKIDLGQAHEQINRMATTDGLTELSNHRTFQHGFGVMIERAQRRESQLCLIIGDIDYFKQVNDKYGHPFGDKVLKGVATTLKKEVRTVDMAARYGGEEFAIVLEDSNGKGGFKMAERIRHAIEKMVFYHEREMVKVTMSFGLSVYPNDGQEKPILIARADQSLYQAKKGGRNMVKVWDKLMN